MSVIRVASYNVRSLRDDQRAVVNVIRAIRPDVLCVQEAPRFLRWRRRRRELAHRAGMTVAAGGRIGGVAVFTGPGVRPLHAEVHRLRWFFGLEWRGLAIAVVEKDDVRLAVASVHLDLLPSARLWHAAQIVPLVEETAKRFGAKAVLAGDINEQPAEPTWRYLADHFTDGYAKAPRGEGNTFTSTMPMKRIDAIFTGAGLSVVSCGGTDARLDDLTSATDHRPVVAEIAGIAEITVG